MKLFFNTLFMFLMVSVPAFGANSQIANEAQYFQNILNNLCMIGYCDERPNPYLEEGASNIIASSVVLAYFDNKDKIEKFNQPLHSMGLEYSNLIPAKMVEEAVCRYYGFTLVKYPELEKAAQKRSLDSAYYFLGAGDPGLVDYKVEKIGQLKNGLLVVSGVEEGEGEATPFKAFFKKSNCGGNPHWVLLKKMFLQIPEESDDFNIPVDN